MRIILLVFLLLGVVSCATPNYPDTGLLRTSGVITSDDVEAGTTFISSGSGTLTMASLGDSKEKCKTVSRPAGDGCNTCSTELCTDGTTQWETGTSSCTLMACVKRYGEVPYDEKEWKK